MRCVCVSVRMGVHNWDLLWGRFRGWEVPRCAVCDLETQESWYCNSVWDRVWRPESQESWWCKFQFEVWRQEKVRWNVPALAVWGSKRRWIPPCSSLVLFRPSRDCMVPTTLGKVVCFTEYTDSNTNLIWKHLQTYPEIIFDLGTPWLTQKINHHSQFLHKLYF